MIRPIVGALFALIAAAAAPRAQTKAPSSAPPARAQAPVLSRAKRDSLIWRRDELLTQFKFSENRVEGTGWYRHREQTVENTYNRTLLGSPVSAAGKVYLTSEYHGRDWIFHDRISVRVGSRVLRSSPLSSLSDLVSRDNSGTSVWETLHFSVAGTDGGILTAIATAQPRDSIIVRMIGRDGDEEFDLEERDRVAIKESFELARILRTIGRTAQASAPSPRYIGHMRSERFFVLSGRCAVSDSAVATREWERLASSFAATEARYKPGTEAECAQRLAEYRAADSAKAAAAAAARAADSGSVTTRAMLRALATRPDSAPTERSAQHNGPAEHTPLVGEVAADTLRRLYFRPGCREDSATRPRDRIRLPSEASAQKRNYRRPETVGC